MSRNSCASRARPSSTLELIIQAKIANLGNEPLVVSGLAGNVLRLANPANANTKLVVQGAQLAVKGNLFRICCTADANLGAGHPVL